jgi:hypothetical protein
VARQTLDHAYSNVDVLPRRLPIKAGVAIDSFVVASRKVLLKVALLHFFKVNTSRAFANGTAVHNLAAHAGVHAC